MGEESPGWVGTKPVQSPELKPTDFKLAIYEPGSVLKDKLDLIMNNLRRKVGEIF